MLVELNLDSRDTVKLIRAIPEDWWRSSMNDISALLGFLHTAPHTVLARRADNITRAGTLLNCTVSGERMAVFDTQYGYTIRISPAMPSGKQKRFSITLFRASNTRWFARIAAHLVYSMELDDCQVQVNGEMITAKAWNAICSLAVAQVASDISGILWDMAIDREI